MLVAVHGNFTLDGLTVARYVALSAGAYALDNELAKDGPLTVGCIGRFENFACDLDAILGRFLKVPHPLPHKLQHLDRGHYRDYYSGGLEARVAKLYAQDAERFGYRF